MVFLGALIGFVAGGAVAWLADNRGHTWVALVGAGAFLALAIWGLVDGLSAVGAAAMSGVVIGYLGVWLAHTLRRGRRRGCLH
ncbi:MAG: hypothetical protein B7X41_11270 [Microbacterium sp. 14-71-5]|jgi:hypothetical protein|nr:MAG: hypothetical protein B7X41_11270 [Microbacterium sp. 14-71-5]